MAIYRGSGTPGSGSGVTSAASDISIVDAASVITATNVEDALQEEAIKLNAHIADTTTHGTVGNIVGDTDIQTLTNKTMDFASNTFTGTTVQFNTALSDDDFATLTNTATLSNKSISLLNNTITGTTAQFNTALTDADFVTFTYETAAPNATVPVYYVQTTGIDPNVDMTLSPKGTGAFLAQLPDGTATGGNKRGSYAVDLQTSRSLATQVASGDYSCSFGTGNTASGQSSFVVGDTNTASANYSTVVGGNDNTASGQSSCILGGSFNTASSSYTVVGGNYSTGSGTLSFVYGDHATDRGIYGRHVFSSGRWSADGDSQTSTFTVHTASTSTLTTNGSTASSSNLIVLPDNFVHVVRAIVCAKDLVTGDVAAWDLQCCVKRGAGVATVAIVGTQVKNVLAKDTAAASWDITFTANTTYGSIDVTAVTGSTNAMHWSARVDTVEVG